MIEAEITDMWCAARLLYESLVTDRSENGETLFEERIVVFQCPKREEVSTRVRPIAAEYEDDFENLHGNGVTWKFREVLEVQEIIEDTISDGTEIFFRFWHDPDARDFDTMRRTHEEAWWDTSSKSAASPARRRTRAKASPARASPAASPRTL